MKFDVIQEKLKNILHSINIFRQLFWAGLYDGINIRDCINKIHEIKEREAAEAKAGGKPGGALKAYISILGWNGLLWGSSLLLNWVVFPLLSSSPAYQAQAGLGGRLLGWLLEWGGLAVGLLGWLCPLYFMTLVLNLYWMNKIATRLHKDLSAAEQSHASAPAGASGGDFLQHIGSEIYYSIVTALLVLVGVLVSLIPTFGLLLSTCYFSLLYGLSAFDCRWRAWGMGKAERVGRLDRHWVYFLGFGAPLTLFTSYFGFFVSAALYNICYPLVVIMAFYGSPIRQRRGRTAIPDRISFALPAITLVDWGISIIFPRFFGIQITSNS